MNPKTRALKVKSNSQPWKFVKSTSLTGNPKDTKVSFKESGAYRKKMEEGMKDPGWQRHFIEKYKRKGMI